MYKKILVALDMNRDSAEVLKRAAAWQKLSCAHLTLLHVVEPVGYAYGGDIPLDLTEVTDTLESRALEQLESLRNAHGLEADIHVAIGDTAHEVDEFARTANCDLILVGSHGRHGLSLLLGSTASHVLHGATCDVLAVRLK